MSWLSQELNKECCLTCQHFKVGRRMKSVGRNLFIEYDATTGTCKLFNNFPRIINCKPTTIQLADDPELAAEQFLWALVGNKYAEFYTETQYEEWERY